MTKPMVHKACFQQSHLLVAVAVALAVEAVAVSGMKVAVVVLALVVQQPLIRAMQEETARAHQTSAAVVEAAREVLELQQTLQRVGMGSRRLSLVLR